jgi:hypothetical protein
MHIDWAALGIVTVVSVLASVIFVILLSYGVRFVSTARVLSNQGARSGGPLTLGYAFIGCDLGAPATGAAAFGG